MQQTDNLNKRPISEKEIDENLEGSFPASDPPSWTLGTNHIAKAAPITAPETARVNQEASLLTRPVDRNDHIQGADSAAVTLLMYGAYECPHCVEGNKIVKQTQARFGEKLRFVFRHFPRTEVHPHAQAAAEVAEAAGDQDKFWEMHNILFENHTRLDVDHLIDYAKALDLDMDRFEQAITGRAFGRKVREDLISGIESGVRGTPTYFIDGVRHYGHGSFESLVEVIEGSTARSESDESFLSNDQETHDSRLSSTGGHYSKITRRTSNRKLYRCVRAGVRQI